MKARRSKTDESWTKCLASGIYFGWSWSEYQPLLSPLGSLEQGKLLVRCASLVHVSLDRPQPNDITVLYIFKYIQYIIYINAPKVLANTTKELHWALPGGINISVVQEDQVWTCLLISSPLSCRAELSH